MGNSCRSRRLGVRVIFITVQSPLSHAPFLEETPPLVHLLPASAQAPGRTCPRPPRPALLSGGAHSLPKLCPESSRGPCSFRRPVEPRPGAPGPGSAAPSVRTAASLWAADLFPSRPATLGAHARQGRLRVTEGQGRPLASAAPPHPGAVTRPAAPLTAAARARRQRPE